MSNGAAPRRTVKDARLVVVDGKATRQDVPLKLPAVLGRGENVTVLIKDKEKRVSRTHCEVTELDGALVVRDLNSKNGTFVNGNRVTESILKPDDSLGVGPLTFRVTYSHQGPFPALHPTESPDAFGLESGSDEPALFEELAQSPAAQSPAAQSPAAQSPAAQSPSKAPRSADPQPAGQRAAPQPVSNDEIDFFLNLEDN